MKTSILQQEILLVTNNSFARKTWCSKESNNDKNITAQEQMEEVCANGLIAEILPEVFKTGGNANLYLWQMRPAFSFIRLQYGEHPQEIKKSASVDPHIWLAGYCYN